VLCKLCEKAVVHVDGTTNLKKAVLCKLCEKAVVHVDGTTNLKNHLYRFKYNELYNHMELKAQPLLTDFVKTVAATHTEKFAKFIAKDICSIAVVDIVGFLNLIHLAKPQYVVHVGLQ